MFSIGLVLFGVLGVCWLIGICVIIHDILVSIPWICLNCDGTGNVQVEGKTVWCPACKGCGLGLRK